MIEIEYYIFMYFVLFKKIMIIDDKGVVNIYEILNSFYLILLLL